MHSNANSIRASHWVGKFIRKKKLKNIYTQFDLIFLVSHSLLCVSSWNIDDRQKKTNELKLSNILSWLAFCRTFFFLLTSNSDDVVKIWNGRECLVRWSGSSLLCPQQRQQQFSSLTIFFYLSIHCMNEDAYMRILFGGPTHTLALNVYVKNFIFYAVPSSSLLVCCLSLL